MLRCRLRCSHTITAQVLEQGASALAEGRRVPFARVEEETSPLTPPDRVSGPRKANPLDHS